ncbi:hypothetical protein KFZ58_15735 [Virgibacillus sp. NKC19-16]|uniref:hypothetical protein n=1 Tax=Virgibacillus salidurans TaxID=2831673 RepID=UPI001F366558|nr:hypothetical protein [Virgibacillus sp. NKC19-16]UJL45815.1 hypothetical protein KFZ58_15735 [Virgibacillus sp. NKC19-16]
MGKDLKYVKTLGVHDYYEFIPSLTNLFYKDLEKLTLRKRIRFTLELFSSYKIFYMCEDNEIIGYCLVSRGGGFRFKFTSREDIIVGPYYIIGSSRGQGKSKVLVQDVLNGLNLTYKNAYDYIRKDNIPSIKATENAGFKLLSNAKISKILRRVELCESNNGDFLVYKYVNKT